MCLSHRSQQQQHPILTSTFSLCSNILFDVQMLREQSSNQCCCLNAIRQLNIVDLSLSVQNVCVSISNHLLTTITSKHGCKWQFLFVVKKTLLLHFPYPHFSMLFLTTVTTTSLTENVRCYFIFLIKACLQESRKEARAKARA